MSETRFTKDHEWISVEGTWHRRHHRLRPAALGDIVFVERRNPASHRQGGRGRGGESVKAASEVYSPVAGEVIEGNAAPEENPALVDKSPEIRSLVLQIRLTDAGQLSGADGSDRLRGVPRGAGLTSPPRPSPPGEGDFYIDPPMRYLPHTESDRQEMLAAIGPPAPSTVPGRPTAGPPDRPLDLPGSPGRDGGRARLTELADGRICRPAEPPCSSARGLYRHHVPAAVDALIQRGNSSPPTPPTSRRCTRAPSRIYSSSRPRWR